MPNIVILLLPLAAGMILRQARRVPENGHLAPNAFVIHLSLPGLVLTAPHGQRLTVRSRVAGRMPVDALSPPEP